MLCPVGQVAIDEQAQVTHLIHFEGEGCVACMTTDRLEASPRRPWPMRRTNDHRAVNCRLCLASEAYQLAEKQKPVIHAPSLVIHWLRGARSACGRAGAGSDDIRASNCEQCARHPAFQKQRSELVAARRK